MAARSKKTAAKRAKAPGAKSPARITSLRDLFTRRNGVILWFLALLWLVALTLYPPSLGSTRFSAAVFAGLLAAGLLALWWRYRLLRWSLVAVYAVLAFFWMLPGSDRYDRVALRSEIGQALRRYEGKRYYRGGENPLGIDGPGLVRRGTVEGTFTYGLRTLNPWLIRKAVELWWADQSARDLGLGARRKARRLTKAKSIRGFDHSLLYPGDFAVTEGGVHAMAYLGGNLWIEADAEEGKVIVADGPLTSNPWFNTPVSILRWRFLEARRPKSR